MKYRPDIDGLRAIAVIPVVFYHLKFNAVGGGYTGVDIFFVLSGYLIASIIFEEIKSGSFSLYAFYERRIRRIFPALFAVLFTCVGIASYLFTPAEFLDFSTSVVGAALFGSNFVFWKESNYFAAPAEMKPLLHTWSLAVEEQFYVFFPLFVLIVFRFLRGRWAMAITPIVLASLTASIWGVYRAPSAAFYLAPTRIWEILLGSLLAFGAVPQATSQIARNGLAVLGVLLIAWAVFGFGPETRFPGANALFPCLGAVLLIHSGTNGATWIGKALSVGPMVFIGKISYSLYLWHWPLLVFVRQYQWSDLTAFQVVFYLAVCLMLSTVSWKFIERPFRDKNVIGKRSTIYVGALGVSLISLSVGVAGYRSDGWPGRFPNIAEPIIAKGMNDDVCFVSAHNQWSADACTLTERAGGRAILWGDSFAAHYAVGLKQHRDSIPETIIQYTAGLCPPIIGFSDPQQPHCAKFTKEIPNIIAKNRISHVIMVAHWQHYFKTGLTVRHLQDTIDVLSSLNVTVTVIGQSPIFIFSNPQYYAISKNRPMNDRIHLSYLAVDIGWNARIAKQITNAGFVDPMKYFCDSAGCKIMLDGRLLFYDWGHFSAKGSDYIVSRIAAELVCPLRCDPP